MAELRDITVAEVCAIIGIPVPAPTSADGVWLDLAVKGINALAERQIPRLRTDPPPTSWPDDIRDGLLMQAQRLFARRSSPTGVAGFTETGTAYVSRWDPDVEKLLGIGQWLPGGVG